MSLPDDLAKFISLITTERSWRHRIHLKADSNPIPLNVVFPSMSKLFQLPDEAIKLIFLSVGILDKGSNKSNEHAAK